MDSGCSKARMNVEDDDRLSLLPDDLIHKILSFIGMKHVIQTSALSSRWSFIWTSMPYLNISTDDFPFRDFSKFINHVLTRQNNQIEVYSVKLTFNKKDSFHEALLKRILDYAFSHDVQQLTVTCLLKEKIDFPLYLFRSRSLKYRRLTGCGICFTEPCSLILASTWELPSLTTLHLDYVAFYDDSLFSKYANLKILTLRNYRLLKSDTFTLCHPQIFNLTLEDEHWDLKAVNLVAPQLENLTISSQSHYCRNLFTITAPNLTSLLFRGSCYLKFSADLCSLEKVDLCITSTENYSGCRIAALLQQLHNVKFLTLNLELVKEIKEKRQKAQAIANAIDAQRLMENLQGMLEMKKADIENNKTRMRRMERHEENSTDEEENNTDDQDKALVEKMQLHLKKRMTQMKRCWEDVGARIDEGERNTSNIISWLRDIEVLLHKDLPASKRDELQARFSSFCAEVDTFVKKTLSYDDPATPVK